MVNKQRIEAGALSYVNEVLVPRMPGLTGAAFATAAPFVIRAKLNGFLPLFDGTEIVNGDMVDVEKLYAEFKRNMQGKWPVEMANFTFSENDLDEVYRYVLR